MVTNHGMKALVLGATGAVGRDLVDHLLHDEAFDAVEIFVRRHVPLSSPKLKTHVVDFDRVEEWHHLLQGDVLFSCLGTTLKAAGSKDAQWKVDYTYQYEAARAARSNGVECMALVSSIGADSGSRVFYTRMKGRLDEDVQNLGYPRLFILRPPSLIRKESDRFGEKAGVATLKVLNAAGLLGSLRPMETDILAAAMISLSKGNLSGTHVINSQDIKRI